MASQNRPSSNEAAPDPATSYERARPENEAGMGALHATKPVQQNQPDKNQHANSNRHDPRQLNATSDDNQRASADADRDRPKEKVDHSMRDEEPLGWDQAPMGKTRPENKRHPKTEGRGGTD